MHKNKLLIILLTLFHYSIGNAQQNIYVSPTGSDSYNGLSQNCTSGLNGPVLTLQRAKQVASGFISATMPMDVIVNIASGTYITTSILNFGPADSGQNGKTVTYKALTPSNPPHISGGLSLSGGWTYDGSLWWKDIGSLYSRQLYMNGQKCKRARSEDDEPYYLYEGTDGFFTFCSNSNFLNWSLSQTQINDLEIVANNEWKSNRIPIKMRCPLQLKVADTIWKYNHQQQFKCGNKISWLENSKYLINVDKEWYIDRNITGQHRLYIKTSSTTVAPQNVVIPQTESFIYGSGAHDIIFNGLIFEYTTWNGPSNFSSALQSNEGLAVVQGDFYYDVNNMAIPTNPKATTIPSPVMFHYSDRITFTNNTFQHIGSAGLRFIGNCNNNIICSNNFSDIAASGISLGEADHLGGSDNLIANNMIENVANEYMGGSGIFITSSIKTSILNNTIKDMPYSGISIGWGWKEAWRTGNNTIAYNNINCSTQRADMNDIAGIYTLGGQKNALTSARTSIHHNYILNYHKEYGAIYLDEGSSDVDVNYNVIELIDCPSFVVGDFVNWNVVTHSDAHNNVISNNYFASAYPNPSVPPPPQAGISIPSSNNTESANVSCPVTTSTDPVTGKVTIVSTTLPTCAQNIKNATGVNAAFNCSTITLPTITCP